METTDSTRRGRDVAAEVIKRIAGSALYTEMVTTERASAIARRESIAAALSRDLLRLEAELATAQAEELAAAIKAEKANIAARVASTTWTDARRVRTAAEYRLDRRREVARLELIRSADARIEALARHVDALIDRLPFALRVVATPRRGSRGFIGNAAAVTAAAAELRAMRRELDELQAGVYGPDLGQRLQAMLDRATALVEPLATPGHFPAHIIED